MPAVAIATFVVASARTPLTPADQMIGTRSGPAPGEVVRASTIEMSSVPVVYAYVYQYGG
jgi:hypothetical protein